MTHNQQYDSLKWDFAIKMQSSPKASELFIKMYTNIRQKYLY
jgi:hypothetical protein